MLTDWFKRRQDKPAEVPSAATLHLSGPALESALTTFQANAQEYGGLERLLDALAAKAAYFESQLNGGAAAHLNEKALYDLAAFMPSVRRRIAPALDEHGIDYLRDTIVALLEDGEDTQRVDQRMASFVASFPEDRNHRWVRDLAAEVLHNTMPGIYPLMTRWMWDAGVNTGVLREIWYSEDGVVGHLDVSDDFHVHASLRDELVGYVIGRGLGADPEFVVDLLCAQIYAGYIATQGASYLKTDFSAPENAFPYTMRMLGLDVAASGSRRTKVKLGDRKRHRFTDLIDASPEGAC
jgi:hypothetical protein